jgi:endo-1,4-beta-D-glucanase Y
MWSFSFKVLLVLLALVAALWLTLSRVASHKEARADRELLERLWQHYKKRYVDDAGFVLDRQQQRITSEGQSYALLRAAWMRDRATFDRVLAWTEAHLKRQDGLYSWLFSPTAQHLLDANTATDADQDIAYALVIAAQVFKAPRYLERAREIVKAVRTVASITWSEHGQHRWFPTAGNWANNERLVNLSYFLPYAYPEFAKLDPEGQWLAVVNAGYDLLARLFATEGVRLPPDFMRVDEEGQVKLLPDSHPLSSHFSFDAMRIYWRIAMDYVTTRNVRAAADPAHTDTIRRLIVRDGAIFQRYAVTGQRLEAEESLSFYGGILPSLALYHPALACALRTSKLSREQLLTVSQAEDRYYDLNWTWFGLWTVYVMQGAHSSLGHITQTCFSTKG